MTTPTWISWRARLCLVGGALALAVIALTAAPQLAQARIWVSVGPCCGYWGPGPYYGYYPPPYAYAPPPGYYPPPQAYYPPPAPGAAPSTYMPAAPSTAAPAAPATPVAPKITYTSKPAFTNSAGQTCREYTTGVVFGTACKQADGQWRVVN